MHLIRLDIDRKNSAAHLQVGPFGGGLNAIYAPLQGGSATMSRFVRSILFRGNYVNEVFETEEGESIDGSMQWVDASGHVRMMSFAGGSAMLPGGFVNSPLHPSEKPLHEEDADRIRGLGNIFWEGDQGDARWDELRGDILGMLFCSPLGSVSPEKLWWSASRLGVHSPARNELDEGYQRLKAEERDLLDRLRNADAVDHDRAWWTLERDRILAEIGHIQHANYLPTQPTTQTQQAIIAGLRERLASIQVELSTLQATHQDLLVAEANAKLDSAQPSVPGDIESFQRGEVDHVQLRSKSAGRNGPVGRAGLVDFSVELQRLRNRLDKLVAEKADVESQLRNQHSVPTPELRVGRWDDAQLRQQLAHSEEMIRRWDRRAQWHRRLSEVQSHLKTRSPYRRTSEGSLIPVAEKYLRELTAGAARQLPPWAVESSYLRGHDMPVDFDGQPTEYGARELYYDRRLPSTDSRQRRLVDLAIRLAIAERAVPRIGRIPFLFDNSIEVFRGEALEQVLHVLAGFARDGRQILIATPDEFIARRIAAHGGAVSRMHEILRYARPRYVMDSYDDLGLHPNLVAGAPAYDAYNHTMLHGLSNAGAIGAGLGFDPSLAARSVSQDYSELNRQLADLANEQENTSWWGGNTTAGSLNGSASVSPSLQGAANFNQAPNFSRPSVYRPGVSGVRPAPVGVRNSKFSLHLDSPIDQVPTMDATLVARLVQAGVHRVGDLLRSTPESLGAATRVDSDLMYYLQCIAELMTTIPLLKPFDARVLVGCGITRSRMLRDLAPSQLVDRVDVFLRSPAGSDLVRTASPYEVNRIREWVASMGRSARSNRASDRASRDQASGRLGRSSRVSAIRAYEPEEVGVTRERRTTRTIREPRTRVEMLDAEGVESSRATRERSERRAGRDTLTRETRSREPRTVVTTRRTTSSNGTVSSTNSRLKFYLDVDSPVVDAPSIGPKMAAKLAAASIHTVGDLLAASPEILAAKLNDRYVNAELIFDWQRQALLVCRVPNLRGHDAQLIVGSGVHSAEDLAVCDIDSLYEKVSHYSSSKNGIKVLRGSPAPDREEVTNWVLWASNCRALRAA